MFAERRNVMQAREELAATRDAIFSAEVKIVVCACGEREGVCARG